MADRSRKSRPTRSAVVLRKEWLSPGMVRLHFGGDDLRTMPELTFTDRYVKLLFPPVGADYRWPFDPEQIRAERPAADWPVTRTYTIRFFDVASGELAIDFVVHGAAGLAGPWAAALDALPADAVADVFVEVADADHQIPLRRTGRTRVTWVHRGGQPYGAPLAAAVRENWPPDPRTQVFVHGHVDLVKDLRRFLFVDHRLDRRLVSISGYWRTGFDEDGWQGSKRALNEQMESEELAALT